jgi:hypothetical protein
MYGYSDSSGGVAVEGAVPGQNSLMWHLYVLVLGDGLHVILS